MHSFVTSKNVKWCHLIWPTLYMYYRYTLVSLYPCCHNVCFNRPQHRWFKLGPLEVSGSACAMYGSVIIQGSVVWPCWNLR